MVNVVILGGGFGGIRTALTLRRYVKKTNLNITLIDKNNFHLFTPSLYQVVTSEEPKRNISIPFSEIFKGNEVEIIRNEVEIIDAKNNIVKLLDGRKINFDYLIIGLGSEVYYRDIPGLQKYSLPFKTLFDAVKIKEEINKKYKEIRHPPAGGAENLKIVIGGGGFSGTELAAELAFYKNGIKIMLIQGSQRLLKELRIKSSEIAERKLHDSIKLCFREHIKEVDYNKFKTDLGNVCDFDILIWTGGVKGNKILSESGFPVNLKGKIEVNSYLQVSSYKNIFAVGDNAHFLDENGKPYPGVAQVAISQGELAAENIYRLIKDKPLKEYSFANPGFVVALGRRFVIADTRYFFFWGFLGWLVQQFIVLRYLLSILPIPKALARWISFERKLI